MGRKGGVEACEVKQVREEGYSEPTASAPCAINCELSINAAVAIFPAFTRDHSSCRYLLELSAVMQQNNVKNTYQSTQTRTRLSDSQKHLLTMIWYPQTQSTLG